MTGSDQWSPWGHEEVKRPAHTHANNETHVPLASVHLHSLKTWILYSESMSAWSVAPMTQWNRFCVCVCVHDIVCFLRSHNSVMQQLHTRRH